MTDVLIKKAFDYLDELDGEDIVPDISMVAFNVKVPNSNLIAIEIIRSHDYNMDSFFKVIDIDEKEDFDICEENGSLVPITIKEFTELILFTTSIEYL